jgi:hypothetical protein
VRVFSREVFIGLLPSDTRYSMLVELSGEGGRGGRNMCMRVCYLDCHETGLVAI